jgi:hypothetical protein
MTEYSLHSPRDALQFRRAAVVETDPGPGDQVLDRLSLQQNARLVAGQKVSDLGGPMWT